MRSKAPDILIVGGGLVGLATAWESARRGLRVELLHDSREGSASEAAAGMLAPAIDPERGTAGDFALAAREYYPQFLAALGEAAGVAIPHRFNGVLQIAPGESAADSPQFPQLAWSRPLSRDELADLEPSLRVEGMVLLHARDGWVDNRSLLAALRKAAHSHPRLMVTEAHAWRIEPRGDRTTVITRAGARHTAPRVVLAAGAWVRDINGLPRPLAVEPVRGQILCIGGAELHHVVIGTDAYAVPRAHGICLLGSTMERVGFDAVTTEEGIARIREGAITFNPRFADAPELGRWAGLRPITPDLLPIVGPDPDEPSLIYGCGHSRNGILLGPLTGRCIAELGSGETTSTSIAAFDVRRFSRQSST